MHNFGHLAELNKINMIFKETYDRIIPLWGNRIAISKESCEKNYPCKKEKFNKKL